MDKYEQMRRQLDSFKRSGGGVLSTKQATEIGLTQARRMGSDQGPPAKVAQPKSAAKRAPAPSQIQTRAPQKAKRSREDIAYGEGRVGEVSKGKPRPSRTAAAKQTKRSARTRKSRPASPQTRTQKRGTTRARAKAS